MFIEVSSDVIKECPVYAGGTNRSWTTARWSRAAATGALALAVVMSGSVAASAAGAAPAESGTQTEGEAGTGEGAPQEPVQEESPAEGSDDDAGDADSGEDEAGDAPAEGDVEAETPENDWFGYGGRATGPQELQLLPDDPAFPVPAPLTNENLPAEVDALPPLGDNLLCDPTERPGVVAFGDLISTHYGRPYYTTWRACTGVRSLHHENRALDWPLNAYDPHDRRLGDAVVAWLTDNDGEMAARFGIRSIIWNHQTWHLGDETGWRGYIGQSPHTDHIHFSFTWDGAQMRTSWWTGVAVTQPDLGPCAVVAGAYAAPPQGVRTEPCEQVSTITLPDTGYAQVLPGGTGAGVDLIQPLLDVAPSGVLDEATRTALVQWQDAQGIPQTGVLDQFTYAAALEWELPEFPDEARVVPSSEHQETELTPYHSLVLSEGDSGEAVTALQLALGVEADGRFGPQTSTALSEFTAEVGLADMGHTTPAVWVMLERRAYPTLPFRHIELGLGDEGPEVVLLQAQLGLDPDGRFGPQTEAAIVAAQTASDLPQTGVVDAATWAVVDTGQGLPQLVWVDERGRTWFRGSLLLEREDLPTADQ